MTKDKNFEELTEEELEELIQSEEAEDLKADETLDSEEVSSEDAVVYKDVEEHFEISKEKDISSDKVSNSSSVREEIEVKSLKDQKKLERERKIEERRLKIAKERMIKQHRRAIKKNPEKLIRYDTDIQNGLSLEIVEKRVLDNLVNDANTKKTKSIPKIILTNFITFFNILTRSSTENNGVFPLLFSTPTISSSTSAADLFITSRCPNVTGSKLPG